MYKELESKVDKFLLGGGRYREDSTIWPLQIFNVLGADPHFCRKFAWDFHDETKKYFGHFKSWDYKMIFFGIYFIFKTQLTQELFNRFYLSFSGISNL